MIRLFPDRSAAVLLPITFSWLRDMLPVWHCRFPRVFYLPVQGSVLEKICQKLSFFLPRLNTLHLFNICSRCWPREPHRSSWGNYLTVILTSINVFIWGKALSSCFSLLHPWIKILAGAAVHSQLTLRKPFNFLFSSL